MTGEAKYDAMRIHIIGGPGSGKTTLAKQLAAVLSVPFCEMDVIGWEGGAGPECSLEVKRANVQRIADQPGWVTNDCIFILLYWLLGKFSESYAFFSSASIAEIPGIKN